MPAMKRYVGVAVAFLVVLGSAIYLAVSLSNNGGGPGAIPSGVHSKVPTPPTKSPLPSPPFKRGKDPFGVLIPSQTLSTQQEITIAKTLAVPYIRPTYPVFLLSPDLACQGCTEFEQAGFKVILTVHNSTDRSASVFPSDLDTYKQSIGKVLDMYHPAVLVVENEENVPNHFSGTPDQYGIMLKAACQVAHQKHTLCTNGGLLSESVTYLVYESYIELGQQDKATSFADRAFADFQKRALSAPNGAEDALMRAERAAPFIAAYKDSGADFVNFHWYVSDTAAMKEARDYLESVTGLPAMCNEMGQRDTDPSTTTRVMGEAVKLGLPYVVWYMVDGLLVKGLVNQDGSLRPTGQAFETFIKSNF